MSMYEDRAAHVGQSAREVVGTARDAGADVARTAKDEAKHVAHAAADQAQRVTTDVRQLVREEVDRQHRNVADRVGTFAQELYTMAGEQPQTPAKELVGMLAARSSSFAAYLDEHGPEVVLRELQDFARRRPGTFIVAAVAAGFVVGRLGKGLWQNQREGSGS
jgi:gas vesicle protein